MVLNALRFSQRLTIPFCKVTKCKITVIIWFNVVTEEAYAVWPFSLICSLLLKDLLFFFYL